MKYAFVTGGTKGIGKAYTEKLLSEGFFVIINYNSDTNAADALSEKYSVLYENSYKFLKHDMSDITTILELKNKILQITNSLDLIIFNAGQTDRTSFPDISLENWKKVFDITLNIPVFLTQELFSNLNISSNIIFTGSLMGEFPHAQSLSYGVSKAAVHSLVKNLVKFFSNKKIRVNVIAPGFIETDWQKSKTQEIKTNIENKIALKSFGSPEFIALTMFSIIENPYINGQCIIVDGGYCYK